MPPTKVKKPRYTPSILCCFICGKSCSKSRHACGVKFDLQVYTMLRHVFEVPAETFQGYLENGPEKGLKLWGFKFCSECEESYVKRCMELYKQWEDMSRKFDNVRSEVIKTSKKYLQNMIPSRSQKKMILIEAREFILNHNYDYDHLDREKHIKPNYNGDKLALGMLLLSKLSKEHPDSSVLQPPKEDRLSRDISPSPPPLSPPVASAPPSPQQSPSRSSSPTPPPTPPFLRSVSPIPDPLEPQSDLMDDEDDLEIIIPPSNPFPGIIVPTIRPDKPPPRTKVKPVTNGREVVNRLVIENINKCSRCGWKPPLDSKAPKDDLKSHMKTAHGLSDLACPACKQPFAKFQDLAFHVKGHCHKKVREFLPIRPSMKIHQCDQCGKNFYNVSHLQRHTLKFHNKPLHTCPHCPWRSTCVKKLARHREKHEVNMTKLSCRRCHKTMTKLTYRRHRTRKCREMFFCNQCNKKFTTKARRQTHYLTAHRDISKPLECEKCGKTFSQLYGLLGHRRYCIGDSLKKLRQTLAEKAKQYLREGKPKRFVNCNQCGKTLAKYSLNNHIKRVHEKEVKFFCELCGQGMKSQRQLSSHQVLHHNCCGMVECKAQFENRQELYNHQIEKHQKEIYLVMCDQCPKICGDRYLEVHKEVHQVKDKVNQDKPFICHICGKGFPLKRYLAKHVYDHRLRDQRALKRQQEEERGQKQKE